MTCKLYQKLKSLTITITLVLKIIIIRVDYYEYYGL